MKPVLVVRHVSHEGLGSLAESIRRAGLPTREIDWSASPAAGLCFNPAEYSGLVVMGGPMNADETAEYPFLAAELDWFTRAIEDELPVLGICLGAQLLAKALGGRVYPNRVKEFGWYTVELTDAAADDPILGDCQPTESVFQWHGDTFDLPAGAVQLARGADCEQQAFRFGKCAWGLQFHWEVDEATIDDWLVRERECGPTGKPESIDEAAIRQQTASKLAPMRRRADEVFGRWANLCLARARQGSPV